MVTSPSLITFLRAWGLFRRPPPPAPLPGPAPAIRRPGRLPGRHVCAWASPVALLSSVSAFGKWGTMLFQGLKPPARCVVNTQGLAHRCRPASATDLHGISPRNYLSKHLTGFPMPRAGFSDLTRHTILGSCENIASDSAGLGWAPRLCRSIKFPGEAAAAPRGVRL